MPHLPSWLHGRAAEPAPSARDTMLVLTDWARREYPTLAHIHLHYDDDGSCAPIVTGFTLDHDTVMVVFDGPVGAMLRDALVRAWPVLPACIDLVEQHVDLGPRYRGAPSG